MSNGEKRKTDTTASELFQKGRRRKKTNGDFVAGVLGRNRTILSQTITLVESNLIDDITAAQEVLYHLLPHTGNSIRIGITGVPGAGKSTFIESFGMFLCNLGFHVAVLAIDPSSSVSKGSILGDKTRMEQLSRHPHAFIRPSASGGVLGGVGRKTRETILVCEAAGFDIILVETVGVGQSEGMVRSMVDFFLLLQITGAGDELQGIKKGVMELADAILINKADGENKQSAMNLKAELNGMLRYLKPATDGWTTRAYTCSAINGEGIKDIWDVICRFQEGAKKSGLFHRQRERQTIHWMYSMINDYLKARFYSHKEIQQALPSVEQSVLDGSVSVTKAVVDLMEIFEKKG